MEIGQCGNLFLKDPWGRQVDQWAARVIFIGKMQGGKNMIWLAALSATQYFNDGWIDVKVDYETKRHTIRDGLYFLFEPTSS